MPLALVRAGVKLTQVLPDHVRDKVNSALAEKDVPIDLASLSPENIDEFIDSLAELKVDIDGQGDENECGRVQVFFE